ncbi:hypothetical protein ACO2Q3_05355 [Caulobacter sp. KR2-114]|uniref:hypothetical protein n=1 Tax=Caulobacter sp. KR2-114 TaxID=3400912 RepID=UPI003C0D55D9
MSGQSVRNLANLQRSASTSRVLNLLRIGQRCGGEEEHAEHPFFRHPHLNRAIILKHRLRRNERDIFPDGRLTATKIVIPIDGADLKLGGRSVFVDQLNYDAVMHASLGERWITHAEDREMLELLDALPSLDPFLLREHLKRHGRTPARCYFEVSDADLARMHRYVEGEIRQLIELCFAGGETSGRAGAGAKLVRKILSITVDEDTEPLRLTLRLEKNEYQEGVFCWKGFLYYKWTVAEQLKDIERVAASIGQIRPSGPADAEVKAYLGRTRDALGRSILAVRDAARETLTVYDRAFASLLDGQPQAFRDFLLSAPSMFADLGERLGAVNHIASFWQFRFPLGRPAFIGAEELCETFMDFEDSLSFPELRRLAEAPTGAPALARGAMAVNLD